MQSINLTDKDEVLNNNEHNCSDKYKVIATNDVVKQFELKGFEVNRVSFNRVKSKTAPHVVYLRHNDLKIGNDYVEVVITNSCNGQTSLRINLGIYRLVCSNGLIIGDNLFDERHKHIGKDFYRNVNKSIRAVFKQVTRLTEIVEKMKSTKLNDEQIKQYANKIYSERLKLVKNLNVIDIDGGIKPQREADCNNNVWSVLNIIQERLIRGGIRYKVSESVTMSNGVVRTFSSIKKSRPVNSIADSLRLNKLAWNEASKLVA